jgi:hypothetical protein
MREPRASVKARRALSRKPRLEVSAPKANVLPLPHGWQLATPDGFVDIPAREAQLGGDLGHGEEFVSVDGVGFSLDW